MSKQLVIENRTFIKPLSLLRGKWSEISFYMWLIHSTRNSTSVVVQRAGGLPSKKDRGARRKFLKRPPKRYQYPVLWTWHDIFSPLRGTS